MTDRLSTARETYAAWVKGEIDLDEIDRRVDAWLAVQKETRSAPPKQDDRAS